MIQKVLLSLLVLSILTSYANPGNKTLPRGRNESFSVGEVLDFRISFGILTIGKCTATVEPEYTRINNQDCYKVNVYAKTTGVASWISDIENYYSSSFDTSTLLPFTFYRKQREGRYKHEEKTDFDQANKKISVATVESKTGKWNAPRIYNAPNQVRDLISGLFFLRTMNLAKCNLNDTLTVSGFFEDEFYEMKVVFRGRKAIKTQLGKINTLVFKPIMPKSSVFEGGESIAVYFSDDKNLIPIRIDAKMFIGRASIELNGFSGLRSAFNSGL